MSNTVSSELDKKPTFELCVAGCGFYLRSTVKCCQNCGSEQFANSLLISDPATRTFAFSVGIFLCLISLFLITSSIPVGLLLFGLGFVFLLMGYVGAKLQSNHKSAQDFIPLVSVVKLADKRMNEIDIKRQKLESIYTQLGDRTGEKWLKLKSNILGICRSLDHQTLKYVCKKWEVVLLRWQNQLSYAVSKFKYDNFHQAQNAALKLDNFYAEGDHVLQNLNSVVTEFHDSNELKDLIRRVKESLETCQKLQDFCIERQTLFAVKDIDSMNGASSIQLPESLLHDLEAFNIQTDFSDFSNSFQELETEFTRLEIENELSKETELLTS